MNVQKGGFPFAAAMQIGRLMTRFENDVLMKNSPCGPGAPERVAGALAIQMALQAGLPVLQFSLLTGVGSENYFAAVQAGLGGNYQPMKEIIARVISGTLAD
ncbi:MAG: hypothetical protein ACREVZ_03180 [Burkholderiales bacterium]